MECELLQSCLFFNGMDSTVVTALKEVYCYGDPMLCARWQVASAVGRENVPPDLTPNHDHLVQGLIGKVLA